jgi:hypothetical protein
MDDPAKRIADAARNVKNARRIFADELEGIERLPLPLEANGDWGTMFRKGSKQ